MDEYLAQYAQTKMPDYEKLSNELMRAKGPDRSMEQFAVDCGVSPPTFSRIRNQKITRPLSVDLIRAIVTNAYCPPDDESFSRLSILDALLEANGMTKGDNTEADVKQIVATIAELIGQRERELRQQSIVMKSILSFSLITAGYTVKSLRFNELPPVCLYAPVDADWICFELKGQDPKYCLIYMFSTLKYDPSTSIYDPVVKTGYLSNAELSSKVWDLMDFDTAVPDGLKDQVTVFAINDQELFYEFVEENSDHKTNSQIAVVLTNQEKQYVEKEWHFPLVNGEAFPALFCQVKVAKEA